MHQWQRYQPHLGFSDSLDFYGLGAVEDLLREEILERMQSIYCPSDDMERCVNVQFAPEPDPRFNEIFDPLREDEVIAGEYPDSATGDRRPQIEAALEFLANVVADTGAHELAHSLGLAQPYGAEDALHNEEPIEGCLMDEGRERPLVERARLDGNSGARFCDENLDYLLEILPAD